jgi:flagellar basal-body rod modification protein FlgD
MSIYPVSATPQAQAATTTDATANSSATDYQQTFMQLLATELQSQDPTQTMDPTTMVTQMVQINQLSDVAGIYSILQGTGTSSTQNAVSHPVANSSQAAPNTPGGN